MIFRLKLFVNFKTKIPKMEYYPWVKCYDIQTKLVKFNDQKKLLKRLIKVDIDLFRYAIVKLSSKLIVQTNLRWSELSSTICRRAFCNIQNEKSSKGT